MTTSQRRFRGVPEPLRFSVSELPDDTLLTENEVAAAMRVSIIAVSKKRLAASNDGLEWRYIDGRPRATAGSLKKKLAGGPERLPSPQEIIRAKAAKAAVKPLPAPAAEPPVTPATEPAATPRRGPRRRRKQQPLTEGAPA